MLYIVRSAEVSVPHALQFWKNVEKFVLLVAREFYKLYVCSIRLESLWISTFYIFVSLHLRISVDSVMFIALIVPTSSELAIPDLFISVSSLHLPSYEFSGCSSNGMARHCLQEETQLHHAFSLVFESAKGRNFLLYRRTACLE